MKNKAKNINTHIRCNRTPSSESVERAVLMSAAHEKSTCRILILKKKSSIEQYKKVCGKKNNFSTLNF